MDIELPVGWFDIELGDIADITAGIGFPIIHQGNPIGRIPFYKVGDISKTVVRGDQWMTNADNYIDETTLRKLKGKILPHGTIVFAKIGEALKLNRRAMLSEPALVDNNVMAVIPYCSDMDKFIYYFLLTESLDKYSAGNAVPSVRKSSVLSIPFPLPPLPEQQRMVAKLDTLFGHLDALKTRLVRIPQLLKDFRQKVLTQAVTGKLTEEWREGKGLETIEFEKIKRSLLSSNPSKSSQEKIESIFDENEIGLFSIPDEWIFANLNKVCSSFSYGI